MIDNLSSNNSAERGFLLKVPGDGEYQEDESAN